MWNFLKSNLTRNDVAICLRAILAGETYVWSDFTDVPIRDPELDQIRLQVLALEQSHPPGENDFNINPAGQDIIRAIINQLESDSDGQA